MAPRTPSPLPDDSPRRPMEDEGDELEPSPEAWDDEPEIPPQPDDPNGVSRDMATVALNPELLQGAAGPGRVSAAGPADWRSMSDAEIMLRVRAGDDAGFNFLIEK